MIIVAIFWAGWILPLLSVLAVVSTLKVIKLAVTLGPAIAMDLVNKTTQFVGEFKGDVLTLVSTLKERFEQLASERWGDTGPWPTESWRGWAALPPDIAKELQLLRLEAEANFREALPRLTEAEVLARLGRAPIRHRPGRALQAYEEACKK